MHCGSAGCPGSIDAGTFGEKVAVVVAVAVFDEVAVVGAVAVLGDVELGFESLQMVLATVPTMPGSSW